MSSSCTPSLASSPAYAHAALVARLAGLTHDLGKASVRFQDKLAQSLRPRSKDSPAFEPDPIRHEWLSAWLVQQLLSRRLAGVSGASGAAEAPALDANALALAWDAALAQVGDLTGPVHGAPPVATPIPDALQAAVWAVCTHHGAMGGAIDGPHNASRHVRLGRSDVLSNLLPVARGSATPGGCPEDAARWADLLARIDQTVAQVAALAQPAAYWEGVMLMARAALIVADQRVSSETFSVERGPGVKGLLYANTKPVEPVQDNTPKNRRSRAPQRHQPPQAARFFDQPLSWHLLHVGEAAEANVALFKGDDLAQVDSGIVRAVLNSRAAENSRFVWQDLAVDHLQAHGGGRLIFNVASTGAGKTLANLKMAFALRPSGVRLAVAFNLRSLTVQTFRAFGRHLVGIDKAAFDRDFCCLMGFTSAYDTLSVPGKAMEQDADTAGAEQADRLDLDAGEGSSAALAHWASAFAKASSPGAAPDATLAKLIASPVLVSTMDWIVAAGEPGQQDRHAKALMRVASSDLILDEIDSFDVKATVAVMRVVQIAALFGRNVIVSSATLNPALAQGLCAAYSEGRKVHAALFGPGAWSLTFVSDQFSPRSLRCPTYEQAAQGYRDALRAAALCLQQLAPTKRYRIVDVSSHATFTQAVIDQALHMHAHHAEVPQGLRCRVSIGLVRMANIKPCMHIAEALRKDGRFLVTAYHAQDVKERRAHRERRLDQILDRNTSDWVEALCEEIPGLSQREEDLRLIVVATPVEEVGRDHDFDWGIIEPSSMHAIIQAAGRINRHRRRPIPPGQANVCILSHNWRALSPQAPYGLVFTQPGMETEIDGHSSHPMRSMRELLCRADGQPGDDVLDAGLVFDEGGRQTRFAVFDEHAVHHQIRRALPILQHSIGYETHFMSHEFARNFPLREESRKVEYLLDIDRGMFAMLTAPNIPVGSLHVVPDPDSGVWLTRSLQGLAGKTQADPAQPLHVERTDTAGANSSLAVSGIEVRWNGVVYRD